MTQYLSLEHWNKKLLLAVDIKTTSQCLIDGEIVEFAGIFVDIEGKIIKEQNPISIEIKPYTRGELTDAKYNHYCDVGIDPELARSTIMQWLDSSIITSTKWGTKRQAMLLGFDLLHKYGHLETFLGPDYCKEMFHPAIRDIQTIMMFANDIFGFRGDTIIYNKYDLHWLLVKTPAVTVPHNAQVDCISTAYAIANAYISMCRYLFVPARPH